jgi:cytochrome oxidase Cu insertion factor (SCO1/SenC/PrrC family)
MRVFLMTLLLIFSTVFVNLHEGEARMFETEVQEFSTPVEAPDFTLKEVGEGEISLHALRGKVVILNFFTTW